ncbi:MAG: flagellar M-ring protein FliF [Clostridiaceae bacterium]|nr:flagellar M-ring protein FliF [Clostridiaceae bacterium]
MDEKMKQFGAKAKGLVSKVGKKTWAIIGAVAGVAVIAVVLLVVLTMNKTYVPLFTELSSEDISSILNYLSEQNVTDYKVRDNDTILVPEAMEPSLKAKVMMAGYPAAADGYALYDEKVSSLSTESDRNNYTRMGLEKNLVALIENFDNVRQASVLISPGQDNSYVLNRDDTIDATATVFVTTRNGGRLSDEVAAAIRRAVRFAVEGLKIENVTIEDQNGTTYIDIDGLSSKTDESMLKLTLESEQNAIIRRNILNLLAPVYGEENLSVGVNTTVDVAHTWEEAIQYYLPEYAQDGSTGGKGIIGSRVFHYEIGRDGNTNQGGVPGTTTNADLSEYVEQGYQPDGNENVLEGDGEYNYDNSQTTTQKEWNGGTIIDCMVSVTINAQPGSVNTDDLVGHVARVAGIDVEMQDDKVSVLAIPFILEPDEDTTTRGGILAGVPDWVLYAAIAGLALFLLILLIVLILVSRSRKKRKAQEEALLAEQEAAALAAAQAAAALAFTEEQQQEPPKTGANIMEIHTERSMELRRDVRAFAESNPEVAAYMVKSWLKEDEEDDGR